MVLLRLRSDDGLIGLGEAVPLSLRGGAGLAQVVDELERLGERSSLDEATLQRAIALSLSAPARCAALTALLDLRGRQGGGGRLAAGPAEAERDRVQRDPGRRRAGGRRRRRACAGPRTASPPSS